jgi:hypothetical protein
MNASIATLRRLPRASRLCATLGAGTASLLLFTNAHAASRTSASYSITTETADAGGSAATSASYSSLGSAGGISGISNVASPSQTAKAGYISQLSASVIALQIAASPGTINEDGTRQLSAQTLLDDNSIEPVPANSVTWSVVSGPVTGINSSGLATAGTVFQNSAATVQGLFDGATGTLGLTVLDTVPDNFGTYAGDGIGDAWQVQYFGQNNPAAAPSMDPDGDGQNNLFEFTAGLVPTDRASVFTVSLNIPEGQPAQRAVVFTPRLDGRTYTVKTSTTLAGWTDLTGATVSDSGTERTVTDVNASGSRQFYRVEISLP